MQKAFKGSTSVVRPGTLIFLRVPIMLRERLLERVPLRTPTDPSLPSSGP